jgi:hypothetical protein
MAVEYLGKNSTDGTVLGSAATDKIGFYGVAPAAQRANAAQATSLYTASSLVTVGATLAAFVNEVTTTLIACGLWKGSA